MRRNFVNRLVNRLNDRGSLEFQNLIKGVIEFNPPIYSGQICNTPVLVLAPEAIRIIPSCPRCARDLLSRRFAKNGREVKGEFRLN